MKTTTTLLLLFLTMITNAQTPSGNLCDCVGSNWFVYHERWEDAEDNTLQDNAFMNVAHLLTVLPDFGNNASFYFIDEPVNIQAPLTLTDFLSYLSGYGQYHPFDPCSMNIDIVFSHGWFLESPDLPGFLIILHESGGDDFPTGDCNMVTFWIEFIPPFVYGDPQSLIDHLGTEDPQLLGYALMNYEFTPEQFTSLVGIQKLWLSNQGQ